MNKLFVAIFFVMLCSALSAQDLSTDVSGKYSYSVVDTPYGDYYGWIILNKKGRSYQGEIINDEGIRYTVKDVRIKQDVITFKSNVEETKSMFMCKISGDSIRGTIKVAGDDFPYVLKGKRSINQQ